jgi:hypothetical protein
MEIERPLEHSLRFVQNLLLIIDASYQGNEVAAARQEAGRDGPRVHVVDVADVRNPSER